MHLELTVASAVTVVPELVEPSWIAVVPGCIRITWLTEWLSASRRSVDWSCTAWTLAMRSTSRDRGLVDGTCIPASFPWLRLILCRLNSRRRRLLNWLRMSAVERTVENFIQLKNTAVECVHGFLLIDFGFPSCNMRIEVIAAFQRVVIIDVVIFGLISLSAVFSCFFIGIFACFEVLNFN